MLCGEVEGHVPRGCEAGGGEHFDFSPLIYLANTCMNRFSSSSWPCVRRRFREIEGAKVPLFSFRLQIGLLPLRPATITPSAAFLRSEMGSLAILLRDGDRSSGRLEA